jgi:hypothetical protein
MIRNPQAVVIEREDLELIRPREDERDVDPDADNRGHRHRSLSPEHQFRGPRHVVHVATGSERGGYVYERRRRTRQNSSSSDDEESDIESSQNNTDDYGRPVIADNGRPRRDPDDTGRLQDLVGIIPDNPFGVRPSQRYQDDPGFTQPILQFKTYRSEFYVFRDADGSPPAESGLARCHVADRAVDWCGTVLVNEAWVKDNDGTLCSFIAVSEAKSFTDEECRNWTHYIAKDRDEVEWDLFYVLLVQRDMDSLVMERVGIGKVFKEAFDLKDNWHEIKLG